MYKRIASNATATKKKVLNGKKQKNENSWNLPLVALKLILNDLISVALYLYAERSVEMDMNEQDFVVFKMQTRSPAEFSIGKMIYTQ